VHNAFRNGKVHVCASKCSTCIFRPGNVMHLQEGRRDQMVRDSIESGGAIICHQTLYQKTDEHAVCRGFFDVHKHEVQALQLAERLNMLTEDPVKESDSE
jgi:hypothetical protein